MADANLKEELARIDGRIEDLKNQISLGKDLEEMHNDEKFIRVILTGYFDKEAERLFDILVTPTPLKRDQLQNIEDKLTAIRNMKQYFQTILINARMAPEQIEEEENYRLELTSRSAADSIIDVEAE